MFGKSIPLITILGFEVKIDASWVFLAALVSWSLAQGFFPARYAGLTPGTYWAMGIVGAVGLFASLVLHELSHSLVARRFGLNTRGITLFIFGGIAELEDEPPSPRAEFLIAIAGPIASFALAAGFLVVQRVAAVGAPDPVVAVAGYLALINFVLAVFNLVPGFPLDGGRVLRAVLWARRGDYAWATRVAARAGSSVGFGLIALGVFSVVTGNFVGGMWWFLIGLFLRGAAEGARQNLTARQVLGGAPIRRYMTANPITVTPDMTIDDLVEYRFYRFGHEMFPVMAGPRLVGCVTVRQVKAVARADWPQVTVGDVMIGCDASNTVDAGSDAMGLLRTMQRTGQSRFMVVDGSRLVGMVALKDMVRVMALHSDLGER